MILSSPEARAPTPPELLACLQQLLPPVATAPYGGGDSLLALVAPLVAVVRLWNVHLRSEARRALAHGGETDEGRRRRLRVVSRVKAQDAVETKCVGFCIMLGLWRVQTALLAGDTSRPAIQPLIDAHFPSAPLPAHFLTRSEGVPLPAERKTEVEVALLRTRRTCAVLRKKADKAKGAYIGPPEGLRDALLAAGISDGPIGLRPAAFEGKDGTARAILNQAKAVVVLWDELNALYPLEEEAVPVAAVAVEPEQAQQEERPADGDAREVRFALNTCSQGSIVEDSQVPTPPSPPPPPLSASHTHKAPLVTAQPVAGPSRRASAPVRAAPSPRKRHRETSLSPVRSTAAPDASIRPTPVLTVHRRPGPPAHPVAERRVPPPPHALRATSSAFAHAPVRDPGAALKRSLNRYSAKGQFDSDSSGSSATDSESAVAGRPGLKARARKKARSDGVLGREEGATGAPAVPSRMRQGASLGSAGGGSQSLGTTDSSLGYVDLPQGTIPRPRQPSPRTSPVQPPSGSALRSAGVVAGAQARGELRRH